MLVLDLNLEKVYSLNIKKSVISKNIFFLNQTINYLYLHIS